MLQSWLLVALVPTRNKDSVSIFMTNKAKLLLQDVHDHPETRRGGKVLSRFEGTGDLRV